MAKDGELTPKQEKFVQNVFAGMSQREAYKQAFPGSKMTDKSVDEIACKLIRREKLQHRMMELTAELKERHMVTADAVISELSHIAFDDISNYLDYYQDGEGNTKVRVKDSQTINTKGVAEVTLTKDGTFKFKLYAKDNALIQLGKHLGLFVDRSMNLNVDMGENSSISQALTSNPELAAKVTELYRISKQKPEVN